MSESPEHAIRVADWVGKSAPAHCTSAGRVLLLDHDPAGLEALFGGVGFPAAGPRAPDTVGELAARIAVDRARGYALVDEEFEAGLVGVAAPIRDARGRIVAALNVSAPKFRFGGRMAAVGPDLRVTADELSAVLGWSRQDEMAAS